MTRSIASLVLLASFAAVPIAAQGDPPPAEHGAATAPNMPEGWLSRFDRASATADMAEFRTMEPGWHVTTGRAGSAIFWRPATTAAGAYRAATTIHLMKPAQHPEAFGLFVGGRDLEGEAHAYLYFLVRQNGQYLIKRRRGAETETVVDWTVHDAVPTASADGSTRYDLAVQVGEQEVEFIVNGQTVHTAPRSELQTDGVVGLRVNHMLDVHVQELEVTSG